MIVTTLIVYLSKSMNERITLNAQTSRSMSMFIFIRLSSIEDALDGNKRILCLNEVHEKAHNPLEYTK